MKTILLSTIIALFGLGLKAQTADVQIIHNSADAAASTVDVYLDGTLIQDDFPFREATAFLSVPAEQEIVVGIAPATSRFLSVSSIRRINVPPCFFAHR